MRSWIRTVVVFALAVVLVVLFLREVDLRAVGREIMSAKPGWLLFSLATMYMNLVLRAIRWRYLLEPIGKTRFANLFRATAIGFAARSVLPSAAGEFVRPYFLSRHEPVSASGAFATVIVERVLDLMTMLILLASFVFLFGGPPSATSAGTFAALKWAGATAAASAIFALVMLFILARHPEKVTGMLNQLEHLVPKRFAGLLGRVAEKFLAGLVTVRQPRRLLIVLALSFPLWLCISLGVWAVAMAFRLPVPFTGSFLLVPMLAIGITIPTPGGVGSFHEAFRVGLTQFFGAPDDAAVGAAIVLHALSVGSPVVLGIIFAAQAGLNLSGIRQLVSQPESGPTA